MSITRRYLGWTRPFCQVFARHIQGLTGEGIRPDDCLVWVPSARAGRHLLNELFTHGEASREGIHPPLIQTPARHLQSLYMDRPDIAVRRQRLLAWQMVLGTIDTAELHGLFPNIPGQNRRAWAFAIGQQLIQLKERLGEESVSMAEVAQRIRSTDRERWQVLARLESAYRAVLQEQSLEDPDDFLDRQAGGLLEGAPFKHVLVGGILNLSPRQIKLLETLAANGLSVDLCLPVPQDRAATLDRWGRPQPGIWNTEPLPASLLDGRLHRAFEPRELVDRVLDLADQYAGETDALVVCSPEQDLADYLVERSRLGGSPFYAPVGKPLSQTGFGRLLLLGDRVLQEGRLADLAELLRNALFRNWLSATGMDPRGLEKDLLHVQKSHFLRYRRDLSDTHLAPIGSAGRIREVFSAIERLLPGGHDGASFPDRVWSCLQAVATSRRLTEEGQAVLSQLEGILEDMKGETWEGTLNEADYWELLNDSLETSVYYPEREAEQRPVSGWLELPWETAPHLVVLGLPDAEVPGGLGLGPFITPGSCREAGLRTPEMETAFHAFRLRLILESRQAFGRVDILLPERGLDDYPSQASRFLFLSETEDLLPRVRFLLEPREPAEISLAAAFGSRLTLPEPGELAKISVTDFKSYLSSPLHYYMERRLRWEVPDALPGEMDARAFGTLAHAVLEAYNRGETGCSLREEADIRDFLEAELEEKAQATFGSRPSLPVRIQIDSLRERLRAAVVDLSAARRDGWRPLRVEWSWMEENEFFVEGIPLYGKIDLIEYNEAKHLYRIVDYKTSDKGEGPRACHLIKAGGRSREPVVEESVFMNGDKPFQWIDLQLPLYALAVEAAFGVRASCAYFNLARSVGDIGLREYRFSEPELSAALQCAEAVVRHIQAHRYEAPVKESRQDRWLSWFGNDYAAVLKTLSGKEEGPEQ